MYMSLLDDFQYICDVYLTFVSWPPSVHHDQGVVSRIDAMASINLPRESRRGGAALIPSQNGFYLLARHPHIGRPRDEDLRAGLRSFSVGELRHYLPRRRE